MLIHSELFLMILQFKHQVFSRIILFVAVLLLGANFSTTEVDSAKKTPQTLLEWKQMTSAPHMEFTHMHQYQTHT